ncbi:hypothetical protein FRC19_009813 [Serendipita sp. 401]|nr:hypothetical protein FRC19_009813 [Serendipita sp. 401]
MVQLRHEINRRDGLMLSLGGVGAPASIVPEGAYCEGSSWARGYVEPTLPSPTYMGNSLLHVPARGLFRGWECPECELKSVLEINQPISSPNLTLCTDARWEEEGRGNYLSLAVIGHEARTSSFNCPPSVTGQVSVILLVRFSAAIRTSSSNAGLQGGVTR